MVSFCHVTEIKLISGIKKIFRAKNDICMVTMDKSLLYSRHTKSEDYQN